MDAPRIGTKVFMALGFCLAVPQRLELKLLECKYNWVRLRALPCLGS